MTVEELRERRQKLRAKVRCGSRKCCGVVLFIRRSRTGNSLDLVAAK